MNRAWFAALATAAIACDSGHRTDPDLVEVVADPLMGQFYAPSTRRADFDAYGLPAELAADTLQRAAALSRRSAELRQLITADPTITTAALCPGMDVPPRYGALALLMEDGAAGRRILDLDHAQVLSPQPVYDIDFVRPVFETVELEGTRRKDATIMGIAAILLGEETTLIARRAPWQSDRLLGTWSLEKVRATDGLDAQLVEYFAGMHLLVELATAPGGICP